MFGWIGQVLRVDLTKGKISVEKLDSGLAEKFLGARGLASKILYDEVPPQTDALSPKNKLLLFTGALTGTGAISASRYNAVTKSPLTGTIAASNSGGYWGPELKFAGFDGIIVEGASEAPVYLWVEDGHAEIRSAAHLWGKSTHETEDILRGETDPDAKVLSIGPAGEKLVRIACIVNDKNRAAGRSGVGAVMGSKKLKAIVVRGTGGIKVAEMKAFRDTVLDILKNKVKPNATTGVGLPAYGTALLVNVINAHGIFPTFNFRTGIFERANDISGEKLAETFLVRKKACFSCPISCGRATVIPSGKYKSSGEGPEYEAAWALGADCGIYDLAAVTRANHLCNELGLDPISLGSTLACAIELYEKGYLSREQAGMELKWGDGEMLVKATELTARREGLGDLLAEGSYRMASELGHPELSMSTKAQEYPAYDPRGAQGIGLNYATSNRGGCHVRGYMISPEILGSPQKLDPLTTKDKAAWTKTFQDLTAAVDSAGICLFTTFAIGAPELADMLKYATGIDYTVERVLEVGERVWNLERLFNLAAGILADKDTLAPRLLNEPMPEGPAKGLVVKLGEMLPEYYKLRGWSDEGVPLEATLERLGLA
ncbi:MAG TPA: aldehyde ferredoxin oxidoreductase family protein [Firmicutes bacterium]|nr:aldehyde ferredoxin oxidoreductase family protein [Bacillota bacterium]